MQNSLVIFTFFCFRPQVPFFKKFGPKNQSCQFKLKFGTQNNSNQQNSIVKFTFSEFNRKYPFWVNLVQTIRIYSLRPILILRLIRIRRVQQRCSFFSVFEWKYNFLKILFEKVNSLFKLKFRTQTNSNMKNFIFHFFFSRLKVPFFGF